MKTIQKKVVIVGSGGAGLRCAIHLREQGVEDLLIIGDRKFTDAHTTQARGGINAAMATIDPEDNTLIHAIDTYKEGGYVGNPHLVELLTSHGPEAINDLVERGANFHREKDGKLTQRFFGAHTYRRTVFSGDVTGKEMIRVLSGWANELEIPYLEDFYVYHLATQKVEDGQKVTGIVGYKENQKYYIEAPIVVFATGGYSNVYSRSSSRNKENFGDGLAMALRAGAYIGDMELMQFHPTGLLFPEEHSGELVTEAMRGEGGILRNSKGERFMEKYSPEKKELDARDIVARANFQEIHEGRGTKNGGVFLDVSHLDKQYLLDRLPKMYTMIKEYNNVDIAKEPVEVAPTTHYSMGGIWFDHNSMETNIEGFYAVGECTMGVHGANRLGGNSLLETMVFGKLIAERILSVPTPTQTELDNNILEKIDQILNKDGEIDSEDILQQIRQKMRDNVGIIRTEKELINAQDFLEKIHNIIKEKGLKNKEDTQESIQSKMKVYNILLLAKLITQGAIERKESRAAHFRSDYETPNPDLQKNIIFYNKNGNFGQEKTEFERKICAKPSKRILKGLDEHDEAKRIANYTHHE